MGTQSREMKDSVQQDVRRMSLSLKTQRLASADTVEFPALFSSHQLMSLTVIANIVLFGREDIPAGKTEWPTETFVPGASSLVLVEVLHAVQFYQAYLWSALPVCHMRIRLHCSM